MLAQKAGVPRHAFLEFMNQSVMGSTFTRYKTPAFVNLDFKVTFTPELLRKDMDLGLDAGAQVRGADAARRGHPRPDSVYDRPRHGPRRTSRRSCCSRRRRPGSTLKPENVEVGDGLS